MLLNHSINYAILKQDKNINITCMMEICILLIILNYTFNCLHVDTVAVKCNFIPQ